MLELLGLIIELVQRLSALVLITFRPELDPPWTGFPHVARLSLSRLTRRHGSAMILGVTGGKMLPAEVVEQIVSRTDGVPLFVEQLTKAVLEFDLLRSVGDHFELAGPLPRLAIPATLNDLLDGQARSYWSSKGNRTDRSCKRARVLARTNSCRHRSVREGARPSARPIGERGAGLQTGRAPRCRLQLQTFVCAGGRLSQSAQKQASADPR